MYKRLFNRKAIFLVRVLIILACNSPLASLNSGEASISNRECNDMYSRKPVRIAAVPGKGGPAPEKSRIFPAAGSAGGRGL